MTYLAKFSSGPEKVLNSVEAKKYAVAVALYLQSKIVWQDADTEEPEENVNAAEPKSEPQKVVCKYTKIHFTSDSVSKSQAWCFYLNHIGMEAMSYVHSTLFPSNSLIHKCPMFIKFAFMQTVCIFFGEILIWLRGDSITVTYQINISNLMFFFLSTHYRCNKIA